jgi:hypothetical protein
MVKDHLLDFDGTIGHMWMSGWRCMNCGNIHDPVVERNRRTVQTKALVFPNGEPDYQDDEVHLGAESFVSRAA